MNNMDILKWSDDLKTSWVTKSIDNETIIWTQQFGRYLADGVKKDSNATPIQARDREGRLKTKFNPKTQQREPEYQIQAPLSTSQLRKFFGEIRRIQADLLSKSVFDKSDLLLLKPKLAYQVGREKDKDGKIRDFYTQLSIAINAVNDTKDFKRFVKIVEAIVAYHKEAESNKDSQNEN